MFVPKQIKSKFNAATRCLLLMLLSVAFTGCTYKISVLEGDFEIALPYTFSGIGKELPKDSAIRNVTITAKYTSDKIIPLENVYNAEYNWALHRSKANIAYVIELFPVALEYSKITKATSKVFGYTLGLSPFPYTEFIYGYNGEHVEFGLTSYLGIDFMHQAYYQFESYCEEVGIGVSSEYDRKGYKAENLWHIKAAIGGYFSGYWGNFALTYSPMIYQPYALHNGLSVGNKVTKIDYYDVQFHYPFLFKNYLGASYWLSDHIKVSAGLNLYSTFEFDNLYKDFNVSFGYWF